ncbi:Soj-like protein [Gemmata obscuriglobus]|uniref:Chromosome partitioning protein ParA n=1 Tax=Gemmata obscuriglobus TaxID=114 RepID=A0A2Z3HBE9_9BACT|nr:AAA family ATPase [Gemmata obscuriglobus]AWM40857.1 chromosome partitioning protein ParA [Gemmata obscuriglobus]QEG25853.1 Soj-like protein [Gemmata obscuriglobus]VTR99837.1 Partitioning or sporulation protein ParA OS=uncultured planctomycete GN=HGMM_F01A04C17 PE=4 SV=1: CbiA [Gemmata obscuriglobus UQM 2246]
MRTIAVINQKGGVGKTTTTANLAAALALAGKRVCVIDLDPQAHASTHLGAEPDGTLPSLYDVLVSNKPVAEVRRTVGDNLSLIPSDINLAAAEVELAGIVGREVILREALAADATAFDYVLMDCGPSLGVLTLNALAAADEVFIPLQPHFLALHGLSKLLETTALVARRINPKLTVTGVVVCLYDAATKLAQEVVTDLTTFLAQSRGANVPWANAKVFGTRIRRNIKLAECPSFGKSVFAYAPKSSGATDYAALANEVMGVAAPVVVGPLKLTVEVPVVAAPAAESAAVAVPVLETPVLDVPVRQTTVEVPEPAVA